jgi:RNA polymerase sigma factor (sigma-70 family)
MGLVITKVNAIGKGVDQNDRLDMIQAATMELMKATQEFKESRGYRFSTYAGRTIRNGLIRHRMHQSVIKVPEYLIEKRDEPSKYQRFADAARSASSIDVAIEAADHPVAPEDEETEFGYRAMRAVRWAVQKLPPVERDIVRGVVFRGETLSRVGKKHGLNFDAAKKVKLQAFAKLRASLQKHV